jgi:hypothetical protein
MVTKPKKDFSVAFLLQDNDTNHLSKRNSYNNTINSNPYWLSGKYNLLNIFLF